MLRGGGQDLCEGRNHGWSSFLWIGSPVYSGIARRLHCRIWPLTVRKQPACPGSRSWLLRGATFPARPVSRTCSGSPTCTSASRGQGAPFRMEFRFARRRTVVTSNGVEIRTQAARCVPAADVVVIPAIHYPGFKPFVRFLDQQEETYCLAALTVDGGRLDRSQLYRHVPAGAIGASRRSDGHDDMVAEPAVPLALSEGRPAVPVGADRVRTASSAPAQRRPICCRRSG